MIEDILYLEPDEEITSVVEKIKELNGSSVSLVIPKNATLIASVINLRLLERETKKLKKQVSIITQDKIGRKLAAQVGIPVYKSVTDDQPIIPENSPRPKIDDVIELEQERPIAEVAEESPVPVKHYGQDELDFQKKSIAEKTTKPEQSSGGKKRQLNFKRYLVTMMGLGVITILLGVYWLFNIYPRATVSLTLKSDPFEQTVEVKVDNSVSEIDDNFSVIPGQTLEVKLEKSGNFNSTGEKEVGTNASGEVQLKNLLGEQVKLASGTTFSSGGLEFTSTQSVTVPAATVSIDSGGNVNVIAGKGSISVVAAGPGDQYNLGAGEFSVSGLSNAQAEKFEADSTTAFTGGSSQVLKIINENDLVRAKDQLIDDARDELKSLLQSQADGKTVVSDTVEFEVIESTTSSNAGDEADSFDLSATIRARTIIFEFADFEAAIVGQIEKDLPDDRELVIDSDEDKIETRVADAKVGEGVLDLIGIISTKVVARVNQQDLMEKITGKTVNEAESNLKEVEGVISAEIRIRPTFREKIPTKDNQVIFEIDRE